MNHCLHIDLKGLIPKFDLLCENIRNFAALGVDSLLLELEDKFPCRSHPEIVHPCAYTLAEYRALAALCRELGIAVIPKLQCVGHVDYVLKHPQFRQLREADGASIYQYCVAAQESFDFWRDLADEVLELFPDAEHFHIGADEAEQEYPCSRCGDQDRFRLFARRVEACADYLRAKGKKVMIWDDVFRRHAQEEYGALADKTIPCVWQYRVINPDFIRKAAARGGEVWGASMLFDNGHYVGWMPLRPRIQNILDWRKRNREYPVAGNIGTVWARIQGMTPIASILELSFWSIGFWCSDADSPEAFTRTFGHHFFGCDMPFALVGLLGVAPDEARPLLSEMLDKATKNRDILEIWRVFNEIDSTLAYARLCCGANAALLPVYRTGNAPTPITRNYLDGVRIIRERIADCEDRIDQVLGLYYPALLLEELKSSRFTALREENDRWEIELHSAQKRCRF